MVTAEAVRLVELRKRQLQDIRNHQVGVEWLMLYTLQAHVFGLRSTRKIERIARFAARHHDDGKRLIAPVQYFVNKPSSDQKADIFHCHPADSVRMMDEKQLEHHPDAGYLILHHHPYGANRLDEVTEAGLADPKQADYLYPLLNILVGCDCVHAALTRKDWQQWDEGNGLQKRQAVGAMFEEQQELFDESALTFPGQFIDLLVKGVTLLPQAKGATTSGLQ